MVGIGMVARIIQGEEKGKIPQMKAFQIVEPGKSALVDVLQPEPKADEVLLKIAIVGYCEI
jgi:D-arabinose 1-dehydrogenase-like Zn-dependent alcohol dehydrogenase